MIEPKIIYETKDFLAVNKPAGLMVHAAKVSAKRHARTEFSTKGEAEPESTLVDWLLERYPEMKTVGDDPSLRPGIVHRLDKDTSGVMLVAKNQEYFEYLKSLFQNHKVKKTYYALVVGEPKDNQGTIDAPIGIVSGTLRRSVRSKKMQKEAVTEYKVVGVCEPKTVTSEKLALLEVHPQTGRTHQIRVHLASIGHPIVGDKLYGKRIKLAAGSPGGRLMLHAAAIEFPERDGSSLTLEAELPQEFSTGMVISHPTTCYN